MNRINLSIFNNTLFLTVCLIISLMVSGCSDLSDDDDDDEPDNKPFEFQIANKSQYTLDYVYLHSPDRNYKETEPLIDNWLEIDDHISINLTEGDYLVTVIREKNDTGPLLAYTTEAPMYLYEPVKLDYFDDYFRLGEIEVVDEPDDDDVVVGSDENAGSCFIDSLL